MRTLFFVAVGTLLTIQSATVSAFVLTSPDIDAAGQISEEQVFGGFGCQGQNVSPALRWTDAPQDAKSFAVTLYDPDAPTTSGWWHWVVFNLPSDATALIKNAGNPKTRRLPIGSIQSRTDFGQIGYGGPCPPAGERPHRYQFTVYALKVDRLPLDENAPAAMVSYYLNQNAIAKAVLTATYGR